MGWTSQKKKKKSPTTYKSKRQNQKSMIEQWDLCKWWWIPWQWHQTVSKWRWQGTKDLTEELASKDEEEAGTQNSETETPTGVAPCCQQDSKRRGSIVGIRLDFASQSLGYTGGKEQNMEAGTKGEGGSTNLHKIVTLLKPGRSKPWRLLGKWKVSSSLFYCGAESPWPRQLL